jgi:hypothetical protein|tara:strand:- start:221 stop:427 length:207 start_codon:yes stop_codon:yes gene_type:complete
MPTTDRLLVDADTAQAGQIPALQAPADSSFHDAVRLVPGESQDPAGTAHGHLLKALDGRCSKPLVKRE